MALVRQVSAAMPYMPAVPPASEGILGVKARSMGLHRNVHTAEAEHTRRSLACARLDLIIAARPSPAFPRSRIYGTRLLSSAV